MTQASSTDRPQMKRAVGGGLSVPKTTARRRSIFAVIIVLLIATPAFLFVAAVSNSTLYGFLGQTTMFWFPLWAIIAVWVTLDASALYGLIGPRPDPLGPKALKLSALGFANVAAMFLFLLLTNGK